LFAVVGDDEVRAPVAENDKFCQRAGYRLARGRPQGLQLDPFGVSVLRDEKPGVTGGRTRQWSDEVGRDLLPWTRNVMGVSFPRGLSLVGLVREAILAVPHCSSNFAEHAGPVVHMRNSGDSFGHSAVSCGGFRVEAMYEGRAFLTRYASFPLFCFGDIAEIKSVA